MATSTLDRVLTEAAALPADEQEMLEALLRQRRIEAWRQDTAAEAGHDLKADISEFYKLFYQSDISDADAQALLDGK